MHTFMEWRSTGIKALFICLMSLLLNCNGKKEPVLHIEALPVDAQVHDDILRGPSVLNDPDRFVWGGSVLKGTDGRYHMLYNTWECGDSVPEFTNSWVLHSKIAYAVSDYPDKEFKFQKIVLQGRRFEGDSTAWDAQMVTNPHVKEFDGKYYLYYVGSVDPGIQPIGSKGEKLNKRNRVQQTQKLGVIAFKDFDALLSGDFVRPDQPLLSPRTRVKETNVVDPSPEGTKPKPDNIIVVNPSVIRRPSDGKYLLYFKGNFYDPHWRGVHGVAIADTPIGPFTATDHFVFDIRNADGTIANGEDPYVWYHHGHQKFYVVLKDFTGKITFNKPGLALLESVDGIAWTKPNNSFFMKKEVVLKNGDTIKMNRLERPQLLVDQRGDPRVLYGAGSIVDINPRRDGASFNVHIPLKAK
ncbi:glycoside hydrolase family protein [Aestuariivivens sediminicola]|uniref:glycoside hydrolase family protein n=1 Tax=Aestuariivivens sediminicola TaxID=2913560 RepID=UPI001F585FD1|nr:glycoside hydrolase family protein [Aestuariivivens sediminicola]